MKYDIIEDTKVETDTKEYLIKGLSKDKDGNIVISGNDSSTFKEFTGYLNENDQVTFEPKETKETEYEVIYMNPIN